MTDDEGAGNPYITESLCEAYRSHLETKIDRINYTVKLTGAIITIILSIVTMGLHFFG